MSVRSTFIAITVLGFGVGAIATKAFLDYAPGGSLRGQVQIENSEIIVVRPPQSEKVELIPYRHYQIYCPETTKVRIPIVHKDLLDIEKGMPQRPWYYVYQYPPLNTNELGEYYFSEDAVTRQGNLRTFSTMSEIKPSRWYYVMTNWDKMIFGCNTGITKLPVCGDGYRDGGESCDDGNSINTDSCRNNCRRPGCGDNICDAGEATTRTNACDGLPPAERESCDAPDIVRQGSCPVDCPAITAARCGNGICEEGEDKIVLCPGCAPGTPPEECKCQVQCPADCDS